MKLPFTILLIHNPFSATHPVTWLSLIIRIVTCSRWNHIAILFTNRGELQVIESVGKGVILTPYTEWFRNHRRLVKPMFGPSLQESSMAIIGLVGKRYGFFDLVQILLYLVRSRWFAVNRDWNGKDGLFGWQGLFCSELAGVLMHKPNAHLLVPADFEHFRELQPGSEYWTGAALPVAEPQTLPAIAA